MKNFGVNNACANFSGDLPYGRLPQFRRALRYMPDVVLLMLGTNDSKKFNWDAAGFREGYTRILDAFLNLEKKPEVLLMLPPHIFSHFGPDIFALSEERLASDIIPAISGIANEKGLKLLDLHSAVADKSLFNDGVHPGRDGAAIIAEHACSAITA